MLRKIIPTILVQDRLEFVRRLGIMEGKIPLAQIDIIDGKFIASTTFADPELAARHKIGYELDIKVQDPMKVLLAWKKVRTVKRAFVHVEIKKPLGPLLKRIKSRGWEAGVVINPDTPWEKVEECLDKIDTVLFMTVYPGQNGAPFQPKVIPKIKEFHKKYPNVPIEVDGGVNENTLPQLLKAGVTRFAVGSAIWSAPDPIKAYKKFLKLTSK